MLSSWRRTLGEGNLIACGNQVMVDLLNDTTLERRETKGIRIVQDGYSRENSAWLKEKAV